MKTMRSIISQIKNLPQRDLKSVQHTRLFILKPTPEVKTVKSPKAELKTVEERITSSTVDVTHGVLRTVRYLDLEAFSLFTALIFHHAVTFQRQC